MGTAAAGCDELREADVADFDGPIGSKDVARLQIPVDDPALMHVRHAGTEPAHPAENFLHRQRTILATQYFVEGLAGDVLHHDPVVAVPILPHVEDCDEVRMAQVQTLLHTAQLDIDVVLQELERDIPPAVADCEIDLAKASAMQRTLDGVPFEGTGFGGVSELRHSGQPSAFSSQFGVIDQRTRFVLDAAPGSRSEDRLPARR